VLALTSDRPLSAFETVAVETPATRATSLMVTAAGRFATAIADSFRRTLDPAAMRCNVAASVETGFGQDCAC
jgi:hypothetical protein